tara:strand:+ start:29 stop:250 length:222 start_codon:yes stop_codon:yes gene_type:complete
MNVNKLLNTISVHDKNKLLHVINVLYPQGCHVGDEAFTRDVLLDNLVLQVNLMRERKYIEEFYKQTEDLEKGN